MGTYLTYRGIIHPGFRDVPYLSTHPRDLNGLLFSALETVSPPGRVPGRGEPSLCEGGERPFVEGLVSAPFSDRAFVAKRAFGSGGSGR